MNRGFLLGLVLAALVPGFGAEKIQPLPKDLPPYGPLKPVEAPRVIQERLENGMTIWLTPIPGFPKVAFVVAVHGGRASDPRDRPGLSALLAAAVTQGTKSKGAKQIADEAQGAGGDLSGDENADAVVLDISVLSSKTEGALDLLADVSRNAAFADSEVEIAKQNASTALEAS